MEAGEGRRRVPHRKLARALSPSSGRFVLYSVSFSFAPPALGRWGKDMGLPRLDDRALHEFAGKRHLETVSGGSYKGGKKNSPFGLDAAGHYN